MTENTFHSPNSIVEKRKKTIIGKRLDLASFEDLSQGKSLSVALVFRPDLVAGICGAFCPTTEVPERCDKI